LTWKTCNLSYVGQTSRNLKTHFQEHIRYIKTNNPQSAYAQHILHSWHEYGTIAETMTLIKPIQNESMLLPFEQFHIQSLHQTGKLIPEQWPEPSFSTGLQSPTAYTQNRASKAAAHKPDTQPSATHHTDNLKTKVCAAYFWRMHLFIASAIARSAPNPLTGVPKPQTQTPHKKAI
jgi:hypothetical protein